MADAKTVDKTDLSERYERMRLEKEDLEKELKRQINTNEKEQLQNEKLKTQITEFEKEFENLQKEHKDVLYKCNHSKEKYREDASKLRSKLAEAEKKLENFDREEFKKRLPELKIFIRIRPLIKKDESFGVSIPENKSIIIQKTNSSNKHTFKFDGIFMPASTQEKVFTQISELVESTVFGHNVCIFAFGETGSGKSFTIEGLEKENQGIVGRSVENIFRIIESLKDWQYKIILSCFIICNENIIDLLDANPRKDNRYKVKTEGNETTVEGITNCYVKDAADMRNKLRIQSDAARNCQEKFQNKIFLIKIIGSNKRELRRGLLCLIDLAGSEDIEGFGTTKSIINLKNVLISMFNKDASIPFHNSKMTNLLRNFHFDTSKIIMFINIRYRVLSYLETLRSLRFGMQILSQDKLWPREKIEKEMSKLNDDELKFALGSLNSTVSYLTIKRIKQLQKEGITFENAQLDWNKHPRRTFFFIDSEYVESIGEKRLYELYILTITYDDFIDARNKSSDKSPENFQIRMLNKLTFLMNPTMEFSSRNTQIDSSMIKNSKVFDDNSYEILLAFVHKYHNDNHDVLIISHSTGDIEMLLGEILSIRRDIKPFQDLWFVDSRVMFQWLRPNLKSYGLDDIYKHLFAKYPQRKHCAEADAMSLLLCCLKQEGCYEYMLHHAQKVEIIKPSLVEMRVIDIKP